MTDNAEGTTGQEYYQNVFGLSPDHATALTTSKQLFEEVDRADGISITDIKNRDEWRYDRPWRIACTAADFVESTEWALSKTVQEQQLDDFQHGFTADRAFTSKMLKELVNPKIKTGRLASLAIQVVSPDELPMAVQQGARHKKRIQEVETDVHESNAYFAITGRLIVGGRVGAVALGARLSMVDMPNAVANESIYYSSVALQRYPDKAISAFALWQNSIGEARTVEARNLLSPFGGMRK